MSSLQPGAMRCHGTRIARGGPSTSLNELLSLNFNSLFSSLLLGWSIWDVYIYIDVCSGFCVLLIVLCFYIMYLLSQVRSLGRCF